MNHWSTTINRKITANCGVKTIISIKKSEECGFYWDVCLGIANSLGRGFDLLTLDLHLSSECYVRKLLTYRVFKLIS